MKKILPIMVLALLLTGISISQTEANPGDNHGVSVTCESEGGLPFIIEGFNIAHNELGQAVSSFIKGCLEGGGKILAVGIFHP